jgi:glycosyltransferase involved in cell wall biosynthesis
MAQIRELNVRIFHFIRGKANKDRANGVNQVIAGLAKYSSKLGAEVRVIGKAETAMYEGELIPRDSFAVEAYSQWSRTLFRAVRDAVKWADVIHLHGTYSIANVLIGKICDELERPYVVTLHDGLSPERSRVKGRVRKLVFHTAVQTQHLARAAAIHVLTEEEATDLIGAAQPRHILCIPNGVDLDDFPAFTPSRAPACQDMTLAYLGRLSPEKNLQSLCEAFSRVNTSGRMRLKLAGPATSYGADLRRLFEHNGVELVGPKFGQEKIDFIKSADLFIHPSRCDVFSIAAMEVLAIGTPLLITRTSNASYFFDRGAYFMCEPTAFGLENGIRSAIARPDRWPDLVKNGRGLVEDSFNWAVSAKSLLAGYEQVLSAHK